MPVNRRSHILAAHARKVPQNKRKLKRPPHTRCLFQLQWRWAGGDVIVFTSARRTSCTLPIKMYKAIDWMGKATTPKMSKYTASRQLSLRPRRLVVLLAAEPVAPCFGLFLVPAFSLCPPRHTAQKACAEHAPSLHKSRSHHAHKPHTSSFHPAGAASSRGHRVACSRVYGCFASRPGQRRCLPEGKLA